MSCVLELSDHEGLGSWARRGFVVRVIMVQRADIQIIHFFKMVQNCLIKIGVVNGKCKLDLCEKARLKYLLISSIASPRLKVINSV